MDLPTPGAAELLRCFWHQLDPDRIGAPVYNGYVSPRVRARRLFLSCKPRLFHHDSYVLFLPLELPALREIGCRYFRFSALSPRAEQDWFYSGVRQPAKRDIYLRTIIGPRAELVI